MADNDGGQKTEEATPKRQRDAAAKGDVLQSRDLGTALVVLAGAAWLLFAGTVALDACTALLADGLTFDGADLEHFDAGAGFSQLIEPLLLPFGTLFAATLAGAIAAPALLRSLAFRSRNFSFKGNRINPVAGLKRMAGPHSLVELAKAVAKTVILGVLGVWLLLDDMPAILASGMADRHAGLALVGDSFVTAFVTMAGGLALIALIDVPVQWQQRAARLRMSRQEVRDEHKQSEGSPELKSAVRRRQHEVLSRSARVAVGEATVILTNPTHFAVALRYRPGTDAAPVVTARGRGAMADQIRALAGDSAIPVLNSPELTRAIYFTARTGEVVREDLFLAVATILAFVMRLDAAAAAQATAPPVDVPPGARFDADGQPN